MNWKLKSKIQNVIALLPESLSYKLYYYMQRNYGGLRSVNPIQHLTAARETCKQIQEQNIDFKDKVFFEIGTGRAPIVPLAYWLMGAKKIITIDLNPYVKNELVQEHIEYIFNNQEQIIMLFGLFLDKDRFNILLNFYKNKEFSLKSFLALCNIEYIAPGDASNTNLPNQSIDFHTSYTVFEHIPLNILNAIMQEGNRIIKPDGMFVHRIDYSDHFSHSDK